MKFLDRYVTLDNMAQIAHFTVTMWFVEHFGRWFGGRLFWALAFIVAWALKEAFIDPIEESPAVAGSGWLDWATATLGAVVGYFLVLH